MILRACIFIILISVSGCAKQTVSQFIDDVKENRTAWAVTIPKWVISQGTNLALKGVDEKDEKAIWSLGKKIKQIRVVADNKSVITTEEVQAVVQKMQLKDLYETYTMVKHNGSDIYVMVQEEEELIKDLAILVHGNESTVVLHLKTELTMEELEQADFSWKNK
jgi:hypothetical protein